MKKYVFIIITFVALILSILILKYGLKRQGQIQKNKETLENEILEVMSTDESDPKIIGYLTIEELEIQNAPIADGTDTKILNKYVGHFQNTSYLEGNVCLCSHNRGNKAAFFQNLKDAKKGMKIKYITKYEEKVYIINEIKVIEETDLSVLDSTKDNRITLITCISNQKTKRLCIIGMGE